MGDDGDDQDDVLGLLDDVEALWMKFPIHDLSSDDAATVQSHPQAIQQEICMKERNH